MFRSLIFIASIVAVAHAYGTGAPKDVCDDLTPQHHGIPSQPGPAPYKITLNKDEIQSGDEVEVTLEGLNGEKFKGFMLQARLGKVSIGSFELAPNDPEVQTVDCHEGKKNAVTHRSSDEKKKITIKWVAPKHLNDKVAFTATIAKDGGTFWVAQTLADLKVRS